VLLLQKNLQHQKPFLPNHNIIQLMIPCTGTWFFVLVSYGIGQGLGTLAAGFIFNSFMNRLAELN
jgi:hypothetical protein